MGESVTSAPHYSTGSGAGQEGAPPPAPPPAQRHAPPPAQRHAPPPAQRHAPPPARPDALRPELETLAWLSRFDSQGQSLRTLIALGTQLETARKRDVPFQDLRIQWWTVQLGLVADRTVAMAAHVGGLRRDDIEALRTVIGTHALQELLAGIAPDAAPEAERSPMLPLDLLILRCWLHRYPPAPHPDQLAERICHHLRTWRAHHPLRTDYRNRLLWLGLIGDANWLSRKIVSGLLRRWQPASVTEAEPT